MSTVERSGLFRGSMFAGAALAMQMLPMPHLLVRFVGMHPKAPSGRAKKEKRSA
jgi:hypothetical protein